MTTHTPPRGPGRPLDASIEADLLRAAQDLLNEVGFDRLTIDAVAKRCGAGKATIYRRWASKSELVVAAATNLFPVPTVPDSGDLREDLLRAGRAFIAGDGRSQAVLANMLAAGRHHPELRALAHELMGSPYDQLFMKVLTRAVERDLVGPDVDLRLLSDVVPTFAFQQTVALGEALTEAQLRNIVDTILLPALARRASP